MGEFIASRLSLGQAHTAAARLLREARIAAPELDARLLLCHATGLSHEAYVAALNDALAPDAAARFGAFVERRLAGEPVSRIIGIREFYGRSFRIDASTLDPRPDTETLIEAALGLVDREAPLRHPRSRHGERLHPRRPCWPSCRGRAASASISAWRRLSWRGPMPRALGVGDRAAFLAGDWLEAVEGSFDLVVANPPYLVGGRHGRALPRGARSRSERRRSTAVLTGFPPIAASCRASAKPCVLAVSPCSRSALTRPRRSRASLPKPALT